MDWSRAIDLNRALRNCHIELIGDWYRDPWGWPELDWVAKDHKEAVVQRLQSTGAKAVACLDVPKENYLLRPAVVIDPVDRLAYQCLVDRISTKLVGNLGTHSYGWRLRLNNPKPGVYSTNDIQWEHYRTQLQALTAHFECALKTDIVSCFASLSLDVVADVIYARAGSSQLVERLISMLDAWGRTPSRPGLPQRSLPSAVICNAILSGIDDILEYHGTLLPGLREGKSYARWMDDMWLFGDDAGDLRRAQLEIQEGLRSLGLNMNSGKTKLLEGDAIAEEALNAAHSAVDSSLAEDPADLQPLDELIERIFERREEASRTSIRFATRRMRQQGHYSKVDDFVDVAHRMPHAADALARLFRDAKKPRDLEEWYIEYSTGSWATIEWTSAQFGTMFSSSSPPGEKLIEHFVELLAAASPSLPMTALAAQRLACWDPAKARVAIAEAVRRTESPLQRRVLGLAALEAGHNRTIVKRWLSDFEENRTTLGMLEASHFQPMKLKADFEG